jgi:hypothetical protein
MRIDLPKGQHAVLRDPEDVTERGRRAYIDAEEQVYSGLLVAGVDPRDFETAQDAVSADPEKVDKEVLIRLGLAGVQSGMAGKQRLSEDQLVAAFVVSWSYELPVNAESMLDIPSRARGVLVAECKKLAPAIAPDFEPNIDDASPTTPSSV